MDHESDLRRVVREWVDDLGAEADHDEYVLASMAYTAGYEAGQRDRWLPIESAPKDGTEILAWRDDAGAFMVRWCAPIDFATDRELEEIDEATAEAEDWFCADFCVGHRLEGSEVPTHWQPITPPGEEEK